MFLLLSRPMLPLVLLVSGLVLPAWADEAGRGEVYSVVEVEFQGPRQGPTDSPARDLELLVRFRHEDGEEFQLLGFWDGDGQGGASGDRFKVRFCPTKAGRWEMVEVRSNAQELHGQREGDHITVAESDHPGFWVVDDDSPGRRWYRRSNGSHQYIIGNTQYSFLSGYRENNEPTGVEIADDIARNAEYFKKLRFSPLADRYPNPDAKPFLNDSGHPTDDGVFSHRPNPNWFSKRVDLAVATAFDLDLIADLILAGPDTRESRSTLRAAANDGDPSPYLRYIAARYGSYPNVWICLCNEFDIKDPRYTENEIARFGSIIKQALPYPTPLSVHSDPSSWPDGFDTLPEWYDHLIIQRKRRNISEAAAGSIEARQRPARGTGDRDFPVINDELSYQGEGDKHIEEDTIEAHLGAFLGGGYASTGYKPAAKLGHYFWGAFDPEEHTAADHLAFLRGVIDGEIRFWELSPMTEQTSIFSNLRPQFRALARPDHEYVLGTNNARERMIAQLPEGTWTVTQHDIIAKDSTILAKDASGRFEFDAPESRAVLFHFQRTDQ